MRWCSTVPTGDGTLRFHPLRRLTTLDVEEVLATIEPLIARLQRRGLSADGEEAGATDAWADEAPVLAGTVVLFVVIGALLEGLPALLIFGPILFPISRTVGVDPVHYGIVIVAAMGTAFFLPPVGVGLSIAAGIARVDMDEVGRNYVPYLVALLIGLALIAAFPVLTLILPRLFLGYKG